MHAQVQRAITKISLLKIIQKEKKFNILAMYKYQAYAHMHAQMLDAAGNEMLHISLWGKAASHSAVLCKHNITRQLILVD